MLLDLGAQSPSPHATCLILHPSHLQKCVWSVMCQFTGFCDAGCWAQRWSSVYIYKDLINQLLGDCIFLSSGIHLVALWCAKWLAVSHGCENQFLLNLCAQVFGFSLRASLCSDMPDGQIDHIYGCHLWKSLIASANLEAKRKVPNYPNH